MVVAVLGSGGVTDCSARGRQLVETVAGVAVAAVAGWDGVAAAGSRRYSARVPFSSHSFPLSLSSTVAVPAGSAEVISV